MYSIKYRSLLWSVGSLFACLCPDLQILSCSRAASAVVRGLHATDVQEEFVAGKTLELAGFAMSASVKGGDEGRNRSRT